MEEFLGVEDVLTVFREKFEKNVIDT